MKKYQSLSELISLQGKGALVTGSARGIGFAIAYRLAEAGASVTIADLDNEKGRMAAQDLIERGFKAFFSSCDVRKEKDVKKTVDSAIEKMGRLNILVNNAGIFPSTPLLRTTVSAIDDILAVNLKGMVYFCREAGHHMIEHQNNGCIINIASVDAIHPSHKGMSIYDASKGAVISLTKSLARELGEYGIRVNAIVPGGILTEGTISKGGADGRATLKEFMARITLGRMGNADDIGRVAVFLASELSIYLTGSVIVADGGYLLG